MLQNMNMKQDLRYVHLVASPFQRCRLGKQREEDWRRGWSGDEGPDHTRSVERSADAGPTAPRPPSSSSTLCVLNLCLSLFLLSFRSFFSASFQQTRTVNRRHFPSRENVCTRENRGGSQTAEHVPRAHTFRDIYVHTHTHSRARVYIYLCSRVSRAHFGSRSRNSVTVHRRELRFALPRGFSSLSFFLWPARPGRR